MSNTSPVSIASGTSAGAAGGSVIDVASLVSQLVGASQAPQEALIQKQTQTLTTEISAVGQLKSALSTFQSSLGAIDSPSAFGALSAKSSDTTAFTAAASSSATLGSYDVAITQLAQAQQIVSQTAYGSSSTAVGTGTLQLSLGSTSFSVSVSSSNDTLSGIAAAINSASGNPGIQASVITGTDGAHLVLSSSLTGAANTISVSETDGGSALSALTYATGGTNYTQQSAAKDAAFSIAGIGYTSASNTVTGALSGVTLNLISTTSSPATLSVAQDTSTIQSNIQAFVAAYNTMQGGLAQLSSYDATTNTAGPLMGNPALSGAQSQIHAALYRVVDTGSATYNTLASIGITSNSDGTLSLNATELSAALTSNFSAVSNLFSSSSGVATSLNTALTNELASGGPIDSLSKTLVKQNNALTQQTQQLNTQMSALQASLTQQYSSLNALLSQLQSTSSYLTQAFATLPNSPKGTGGG